MSNIGSSVMDYASDARNRGTPADADLAGRASMGGQPPFVTVYLKLDRGAVACCMTTSTYDAANQLVTSVAPDGTTTYTFDAAGNQQIDQAPGGTTTRTWNYENQQTRVVLPTGQRVTMAYNADFRMVRRED